MLSLLLTLAMASSPATPEATAKTAAAPGTSEPATTTTASDAPTTTVSEAPASTEPKRLKLLVLDVKAANPDDVDAGQVETLTSFIAARAARFPFDVVSSADIRDMLELEGQKQEVGCDTTSTSCLGEIAGALGADLVLSTRAGKLDAVYVIALQLFDARAATGEGRASVEAWSLGEATPKIGPAVDELLTKATGAVPTESTVAPLAPKETPLAVDDDLRFGLKVAGGAAAGVGVVTAILGAVPALVYSSKKDDLGVRTDRFEDANAVRQLEQAQKVHEEALSAKALYNDVGRWAVLGGALLVVAGGATLAAGFLLPAPTEAPTEGGAP